MNLPAFHFLRMFHVPMVKSPEFLLQHSSERLAGQGEVLQITGSI